MRAQGAAARAVQIFVQASPFKPGYYGNSAVGVIAGGADHTPRLMAVVRVLLERIYRPGIAYKRAGVVLMDIVSAGNRADDLFRERQNDAREARLMKAVDRLDGRVLWASEMAAPDAVGKQSWRSMKFTTRWQDVLAVV